MKSWIFLSLLIASLLDVGSCQGDPNAYIFINNFTSSHVVPVTTQEILVLSTTSQVTTAQIYVIGHAFRTLIPNLCSTGFVPCDAYANCNDSFGDSAARCTCPSGFNDTSTRLFNPPELDQIIPAGTSCTDIDECLITSNCDTNALCTNIPGSYFCTCNSGYSGDGATCSDINECANPHVCGAGTFNCTNSQGSFSCECNVGYRLSSVMMCEDINECLQTGICDVNAECTNAEGSFSCACKSGFVGNGNACEELALPSNPFLSRPQKIFAGIVIFAGITAASISFAKFY